MEWKWQVLCFFLLKDRSRALGSESKLLSWSCCVIFLVCLVKTEGIAFSSSVTMLVLEAYITPLRHKSDTSLWSSTMWLQLLSKRSLYQWWRRVFSLCVPDCEKMNTLGIKIHLSYCHHLFSVQAAKNWTFSPINVPASPTEVMKGVLKDSKTDWWKLLAVLFSAQQESNQILMFSMLSNQH